MQRRNRRKKLSNEMNGKRAVVLSTSANGEPLATSSPDEKLDPVKEHGDLESMFVQHYQQVNAKHRSEFLEFVETIGTELLDMPFSFTLKNYDMLMADSKTEEPMSEPNGTSNVTSEAEFKMPHAVPKLRKKDFEHNRHPSTSWQHSSDPKISSELNGPSTSLKSVHWNLSAGNDTKDNNFKTPLRGKGISGSGQSVSTPKTPNLSRREPYALVIPGPMMNKNVKVLRMPEAGETAVSLSGSPLLVTPFGTHNRPQITLTLPSDNGKVMTILQPDSSDASEDDEVISQLDPQTKKQLHELANFLLESINSSESH